MLSASGGEGLEAVSFVNGVHTSEGGTHVDHVLEQVVPAVLEAARAKAKGSGQVTPQMVRNHLFVFVSAGIVNPTFSSQAKTKLVTPQGQFGSACKLSAKTLKKLVARASGLVQALVDAAEVRGALLLKKSDGKKAGRPHVDKLEDAACAGGREAAQCTLVLTEGDSAKAMVMAGLGVVGRRHWGVFPLLGKIVNARDESAKVSKNKEFVAIKKIMGLKQGVVYDSVDQLRYGRIMVAADQDTDGIHIRGLVTNMFAKFWPSLLEVPDFISAFRTPVVKVTRTASGRAAGARGARRRGAPAESISFFNEGDYERWRAANNGGAGWTAKYYKGLGTSSSAEAKEYFADLDRHRIDFDPARVQDFNALDMAFNKKKAGLRKEWIRAHRPGSGVDHGALHTISYEDFVNKELILFAMAANDRSIACATDGLKTTQRKVLFAAFKRKLTRPLKVASLGGYVTEHAAYHHGNVAVSSRLHASAGAAGSSGWLGVAGEKSMADTVIGMAQSFVGANNVPLLEGLGQFGTRAEAGKNAASPRYIETQLAPVARLLFPEGDDEILEHLVDDGKWIEPLRYYCVLPGALLNGSNGIGFGWASSVPAFNPRDLLANVRSLLAGGPYTPMVPWARGFRGTITPVPDRPGLFYATGRARKTAPDTVIIDEAPLGLATAKYAASLRKLQDAGKITRYESPPLQPPSARPDYFFC